MFPVNLVRLLLLVGVLYGSGVDATEHQRKQPSDLRETIESVYDAYARYTLNHDTDALVNLHDPDVRILIDGLPPVVGHDGLLVILDLVPKIRSRMELDFKEVKPLDEDANYVYAWYHYDFFDQSGDDYMNGIAFDILKKTTDGYKFYVVTLSKHKDA